MNVSIVFCVSEKQNSRTNSQYVFHYQQYVDLFSIGLLFYSFTYVNLYENI